MTVNLPAVQNHALVPAEHEMQVFYTMAEAAVESKFYKNIGGKAEVMMLMLAARELNIPPMMALNGGIRNINGNIEISARMMNAMMRRAGLSIQTLESTEKVCIIKGTRPNGDTETVKYSVADAQQAGLIKVGGGWTKNPTDMVYARAISRLARRLAADIIGGCYVEGEIQDAKAGREMEQVQAEVVPEVEEADWICKYLGLFEMDAREDALKYMDAVKTHQSISTCDVCRLFLAEPEKTVVKFAAWRKQACAKRS